MYKLKHFTIHLKLTQLYAAAAAAAAAAANSL